MIDIIVIAVVFVFVTYLVLFFSQRKLIYRAPHPSYLLYKKYKNQSLVLTTSDFTNLYGWCIPTQSEISSNIEIIYFGGNAQDSCTILKTLSVLPAQDIFTFNYRGYGQSEGYPSEKTLCRDSLEIFDLVRSKNPKSKIVVIGYSLGSSIAGYLATRREVHKLVLLCPLSSISRIASERFLIPRIVIKDSFDLERTAKKIEANSLVILAENDLDIPASHSRSVYENISGQKLLKIIGNENHNTIFD
ncbi:alpha/beta hydrolase [Thalassolituus oleivorans]|uniref:AB hydrolase-1 domain-containing protein n=1 Tax=Thalassolituus oleivorans MIL-1 TaxID=1298593 RepID=M5DY59_9GAMM|nr:alpha/beta fold hydrolase [Thalassolituus oleivorans]CCU70459.1 hypothetical protein TOL_0010 [Thalassolituus oleivorans MIL-1]